MRDKSEEFAAASCEVVGISFDTPEDNSEFRTKQEFPFTLLSDEDKSIGATYHAVRDPDDNYANFPKRISYLIDPEGTIQKAYEVSDPAGHAAAVLADLAAFQR